MVLIFGCTRCKNSSKLGSLSVALKLSVLCYLCPPPGYCFTIEHGNEYRPIGIDIEYCEQVEEIVGDSSIILFKRLSVVPKTLCLKHIGPYERFYESYSEAFNYMEELGYKMVGYMRTCYIDGVWNQDDPELWLSFIQIPIE